MKKIPVYLSEKDLKELIQALELIYLNHGNIDEKLLERLKEELRSFDE
jgi:hypothetical protein